MTWDWHAFFIVFGVGPLLSTLLLGLMIGAFYGFSISPTAPPLFPYSLWLLGVAFIVLLAVFGIIEGGIAPEPQVGRFLLWTTLCGSIPVGRWARIQFERQRTHRKRDRLP